MGDQDSKIVVGVDSSGPSKAALRWAARQAELTGATLRVVGSWYVPMPVTWIPVPEPKGWDLERATREELDRTILEVLGTKPTVPVQRVVVEGPPAQVLLDQAHDADLLVVGTRGHGQVIGILIGSVSEHSIAHADCPVVVVRSKDAKR